METTGIMIGGPSTETSHDGAVPVSTISTQKLRLHKVNMYLTRDLIEEMHTISRETGVPASELVRRALRASFAEYREQKKWNELAAQERAEAQHTAVKKRRK